MPDAHPPEPLFDDGAPPGVSPGSVIASVRPSPKNPAKSLVKVGAKVVARVATSRVGELGLETGVPWTAELAQRVEACAQADLAASAAARALGRRAKSRRKVDQDLRRKDFDENARAAALDRMEALGAIDDRALGESLVRQALNRKPAGPRYLQAKLQAAGLDRSLADELSRKAGESRSETGLEGARALVAVRLRGMRNLEMDVKRRRLYGMLARRGFDPDVIRQALSELARPSDDDG
ncbi:MAG: regulatory protein RecX [Planctomycetota bacterium]